MDSFTSTVIAGLVIILGLLVLFNGIGCQGYYCFWSPPATTTTTIQTIANMSGDLVGVQEAEVFRPIHLGNFNVSYLSGSYQNVIGGKTLFNGLMFGSSQMDIHTEVPTDTVGTRLEFDVGTTNGYGAIEINVNGKTIEKKKYEMGHYSVNIPKDLLENSNTIKLIPESSYWRIWAPTYYEISNVTVVSDTLSFNGFETYFNVYQKEFDKMNAARLDTLISHSEGYLVVEINRHVIFDGVPHNDELIAINKSYLKVGMNQLILKTRENGKICGNALLVIVYKNNVNRKIERTFNITDSEYNSTTIGRILFDVTGIVKDGDIIVKLDGKTICYQEGNCRPTAELRHYVFTFNQTDINRGLNNLTIEGFEGLFSIDNVAVQI